MASYAERGSDWNGAERRTVSNHSSTLIAPRALAATVCWARMSSGFRGTWMASIFPASIRSVTIAVCSTSPRCLGNRAARLISPTWCPARPTRWSPEAADGGASTWITRSTAPMSMPSSRLLVATTQRSTPDFSSSSTCARCSFDTEPWWALASTGSAPAVDPACAIIAAGTVGSGRATPIRSA